LPVITQFYYEKTGNLYQLINFYLRHRQTKTNPNPNAQKVLILTVDYIVHPQGQTVGSAPGYFPSVHGLWLWLGLGLVLIGSGFGWQTENSACHVYLSIPWTETNTKPY